MVVPTIRQSEPAGEDHALATLCACDPSGRVLIASSPIVLNATQGLVLNSKSSFARASLDGKVHEFDFSRYERLLLGWLLGSLRHSGE